ncbi:cytoplasmic protein [Thermodesulfobacteriota bacterium]
MGFGLNRETDEKTVCYYLQKFSDDVLMGKLLTKLSDDELEELFFLMTRLLKKHLTNSEYHHLFLKDDQKKDG